MVDLGEEGVGTVERAPPPEDGVCDLQDSVVDLGVVCCEARNQILHESISSCGSVIQRQILTSTRVSHLS